ncbi:hypothetical protein BU17DRAFT_31833, partial [Hysterangium stoloniferum]
LIWAPGHKGVKGSERADVMAKKAAEGQSNDKQFLPKSLRRRLPASASALKKKQKETLSQQHTQEF